MVCLSRGGSAALSPGWVNVHELENMLKRVLITSGEIGIGARVRLPNRSESYTRRGTASSKFFIAAMSSVHFNLLEHQTFVPGVGRSDAFIAPKYSMAIPGNCTFVLNRGVPRRPSKLLRLRPGQTPPPLKL
jgi:hypothetical protein